MAGKPSAIGFGFQPFNHFDRGMNFFHATEGRNFELTIKKKGEYPTYSNSSFSMD